MGCLVQSADPFLVSRIILPQINYDEVSSIISQCDKPKYTVPSALESSKSQKIVATPPSPPMVYELGLLQSKPWSPQLHAALAGYM